MDATLGHGLGDAGRAFCRPNSRGGRVPRRHSAATSWSSGCTLQVLTQQPVTDLPPLQPVQVDRDLLGDGLVVAPGRQPGPVPQQSPQRVAEEPQQVSQVGRPVRAERRQPDGVGRPASTGDRGPGRPAARTPRSEARSKLNGVRIAAAGQPVSGPG